MVENDTKSYWRDPLIAFGRMSGWVVGPVLLALVAGKWLDARYHTAPYFFLGLTAVAFVVSIYGLVRETNRYLRSIKEKYKKQTNESAKTFPEIESEET